MSWQASSWASEQTAGGSGPKLVLMMISNHVDKYGVGFAGRKLLASECECRDATISANLAKLEEAGLIQRFQRRRANGSRTSDWIVLGPLAADRGKMLDADADEYPSYIVEAARSGADTVPTSGALDAHSQVRFSGRPPEPVSGNGQTPSPNRPSSSKKIVLPADEPIGFAEWLGYHSEKVDRTVPRAATDTRTALCSMFAGLMGQGYELEDFKLATDGIAASEWHMANGATKFATVLRKTKFDELVAEGRKARAKRAAGGDSWSERNAARLEELSR